MTETSLSILRDGESAALHFPPGSARAVRCDIGYVSSGELRRTVNGELVDLTRAELRKLTVSLSADGLSFPDLRRLWRGQRISVALPLLWSAYLPADGGALLLERPAASWALIDAVTGLPVIGAVLSEDGLSMAVPAASPAVLLSYQPRLACRVLSASVSGDEWEASATWGLELEEV